MDFGRTVSSASGQEMTPRKTDLREVFNALQHMRDTGCQWRAIPPCFPPAVTIQYYFHLWRDSGVFTRMMDRLRALKPLPVEIPQTSVSQP